VSIIKEVLAHLQNLDFTSAYLTPALLSDHLFRPQGNITTIAPKIIIAYIWDIISINYHLRLTAWLDLGYFGIINAVVN